MDVAHPGLSMPKVSIALEELGSEGGTGEKATPWKHRVNPLKRKTIPDVPSARGVSGEYSAGLISSLYFQWMVPLLSVGYRRPLELNDIWRVNPDRSVEKLTATFKECLQKRKVKAGKLDPLIMAMYDTFKTDFLLGGITNLIAGLLQVLSPFVLKYLIQYVQEAYGAKILGAPPPGIGRGIGLVLGIAAMQLLQSICINQYYYRGMILGGQARSTIIACITEKAMNLSGRAKVGGGADDISQAWNNGKIGNLMSTDTSRIDSAALAIHQCWVSAIQVMLALALLCINLTYSALVGFALFVGAMPLLGMAIGALMARRDAINKLTDERIHLTQETFNAIRIVKYFSWESKLLSRLDSIRGLEIRKIAYLLSIRNAVLAVAVTMPILASMLSFITYSLSGHALTAAPIFSSLALFNALGAPLELLPTELGRTIDALSSIKRISAFLDAEEATDDSIFDLDQKDAVIVREAAFTWERGPTQADPRHDSRAGDTKDIATGDTQPLSSDLGQVEKNAAQPPFSITNVSFSIGRKDLVAVIGSIGSGKSSLLSALAGDMRRTSGIVSFGGTRAWCSQYPWVQNTSLRENITLGNEVDQIFYDNVVEACALRRDIEILPSGDSTEIGEKGVTLSGGQRSRLSLARAIYFNADVVLMDDPLSAVDAHVGRHIVDHAICGLLRDKCRILATHQMHVLPRTDKIIWLKEGSIHKIATFEELIAHDVEFQRMMQDANAQQHAHETRPGDIDDDPQGTEGIEGEASAIVQTNQALMQDEERATGSVSWTVYAAFIRASGSMWNLALVTAALAIAQGANILTTVWLSWWTSDRFITLGLPQYMGVYAGLGVLQALLMFTYATILTTVCARAGKTMLNKAISHTIRAPVSFFDTTPIGRTINRFSKDVDVMDNLLTDDLRFLLYVIATVTSVFCLVIAYYYYFAIALFPLILTFVATASYYRKAAREIKRHEAILRSHVFARFSEILSGIPTIRAYGVRSRFLATMKTALDSMDGAYFLTFAGQRWLSTRLDLLGALLIFIVGILIVTSRFQVDPSVGGVVLSYMLSLVQLMQLSVHTFADVQNEMNSVERLYQYGHQLEQEETLLVKKHDVRDAWPERGEIHFESVEMRYRTGLPLALKGLTVHIDGGQRVGIAGRTGAGKSSIIATMFRLVELSRGCISIDGVDIAKIPLQVLRSRLSILPQDPALFRGTIRSNLDPFDEHEDIDLWQALRKANFVTEEDSFAATSGEEVAKVNLDYPVEDEGLNFSLGQRQLLAMARVLLKDSQVILFDEATSSVDFETDRKLQQTIHQAFKGKTLLCIAHRLDTIISYDTILIMDNGSVAEHDTALKLFDKGGIFRGMCDRSGISRDYIVSRREAYGES